MQSPHKQLFMIFLAYYGINSFFNIYFIFGPLYASFGASSREVGLFLSIFYAVMIMCRPVGSYVMERVGARRTLIGTSVLSAVSSLGILFFIKSPNVLLFFRAMSGVSVSLFIVSALAYQSMLLDDKTRGVGIALFTTGSMLPLATVVPVAEWLIKSGYEQAYLLFPTIIALLCLTISVSVSDIASKSLEKNKKWGTYKELFTNKGMLVLCLTMFLMSIADGSTNCAAFLAKEQGFSVSVFTVTISVSAILIRTLGFRFISGIPRAFLAAPSAALIGLAMVFLSFSSSVPLVVFSSVLFGLGVGVGFPTYLALIGDILPKELHPKATGSVLIAMDAGWCVTPILYGIISSVLGIKGAYLIMGSSVVILAAIVHFTLWVPLYREKHSVSSISNKAHP